jgi:hypothetical protein
VSGTKWNLCLGPLNTMINCLSDALFSELDFGSGHRGCKIPPVRVPANTFFATTTPSGTGEDVAYPACHCSLLVISARFPFCRLQMTWDDGRLNRGTDLDDS